MSINEKKSKKKNKLFLGGDVGGTGNYGHIKNLLHNNMSILKQFITIRSLDSVKTYNKFDLPALPLKLEPRRVLSRKPILTQLLHCVLVVSWTWIWSFRFSFDVGEICV